MSQRWWKLKLLRNMYETIISFILSIYALSSIYFLIMNIIDNIFLGKLQAYICVKPGKPLQCLRLHFLWIFQFVGSCMKQVL